jgi:hypothetical protein
MPNITNVPRDNEEQTEYILGFQKGLNKLQDESLIEDNELSTMENAKLVVDGVEKRDGTMNFGSSSGSRVYGGSPFYTSASSDNRWIIREGGTSLMYYNSTNTPTNISGATMTANKRTSFAIARDALYVENGSDNLVKVDIQGGVPTANTFTSLSTPTNVQVAAQGTSGSTKYSYRVSAINENGETLASVSVAITDGNAELDETNFNRITWDAVTNATGYVIYGREGVAQNGLGETKLSEVGTGIVQYDDTGVDTPSSIILPPEGNSTGGQKGSMIIYAFSRLFIAGDSDNPSRLYYSAGGTQVEDFSSAYGGGWIDVSKNDGDKITAIHFYQNKIIVFKRSSIWQFSFTSDGLPNLELVTGEVGCESFRTVRVVDNDLWFLAKVDGRAAVYSLGNVRNYFNALRTTEKSLPISRGSHLDSTNVSQLENACAYYFRNQYILSVAQGDSTINNRCYVYDTRFSTWIGWWDNIYANDFFAFEDEDGNEDLYYCSENSGYIVKMFTGTDDNGTAIPWKVQTKNFNQGRFDQYKFYRNPIFWFKDVSGGSITGYIVTDGIFASGDFNITPLVSGIGFGFDRPGTFMPGTSLGASTTTSNSDQPTEIITNKLARAIKFELDDANASSSFKFLGLSYKWLLLEGKPLPATNRVRLTS